MRPLPARLVIALVVLVLPLAPIPSSQLNSSRATAACVRLPWQPKDKCKIPKVHRQFASNSTSKEIADALEAAYLEVINSFKSGKDAYRKYGANPQRRFFDATPHNMRYQNAVIALGGLVATYPQSVQPSKLAWFRPVHKNIEQCFPKCTVNWLSVAYK